MCGNFNFVFLPHKCVTLMDAPLVKTFLPTGHKIDKINIHKLIMITIIVLFRLMLVSTAKVDFFDKL